MERDWLGVCGLIGLLVVFAAYRRRPGIALFCHASDWAGLGMVLAYLIATCTAVNARAATVESVKLLAMLAVYWLIVYGGFGKRERTVLLQAMFWGGLGVALLGIAAALGLVQIAGSYLDGRIYSTFQYPNTLATYLGVLIILGVYLWQECHSNLQYAYPVALYLMVVCLFGTGSRGGIGTFMLGLPFLCWALPALQRGQFAMKIVSCIGMGSAAWACIEVVGLNSFTAVLVVMLGALCSVLLAGVIRHCTRRSCGRLASVVLPWALAMALLAFGIAAFGYVVHNGGSSSLLRLGFAGWQAHSFQERLAYYQDGLKMLMDRPVTGFGGGGWAMYLRYRSYPYIVNDPHSQVIKVAVESGWLGLLCLLAWWALLVKTAWLQVKRGNSEAAVLLGCACLLGVHSLIDFDLSYGSMQLLLWILGALIVAGEFGAESIGDGIWHRYISFGMMFCMGVLVCGMSFALLTAANLADEGELYAAQGNNVLADKYYRAAVRWDPLNSSFPAALARIYLQHKPQPDYAQAEKFAKAALQRNSADPGLKQLVSGICLKCGQLDQAVSLAEDNLSFANLQPVAYVQLAEFYRLAAASAQQQGKAEQARGFLRQGAGLARRLHFRLSLVPDRAAQLWLGGVPEVPVQLQRECAAMAAEAKPPNF